MRKRPSKNSRIEREREVEEVQHPWRQVPQKKTMAFLPGGVMAKRSLGTCKAIIRSL